MTPYEKELLEALRLAAVGALAAMPRDLDEDEGLTRLENSLHDLAPVEATKDMASALCERMWSNIPEASLPEAMTIARKALESFNGDADKACESLRNMGVDCDEKEEDR
jgi:hypothetical protein